MTTASQESPNASCGRAVPGATLGDVFRYVLVLPDGEPHDPAVLVTSVADWSVEEGVLLGSGERLRILAIETGISDRLIDAGFNGVFVVEPV
jgi:hypothetical protein